MTPLAIGLGVAGIAWGLAADRIGARWPAHDDGSVRSVDWRTVVVALIGGWALAAVGQRFPEPVPLAIFGGFVVALILLLATDLDQRLLPDVITLPLIPIAGIVAVSGLNPHVADALPGAVLAAVLFPLALWLLSIPFGPGAIGMGDLKLMVSVGLVAGLYRTLLGLVTGALLSGVVVLLLLVSRRVTMRTYIPFGPFLILGAIWGLLSQP
jgi:leader peptidase (prepilin peptidase) / N-methyltransferase